MTEPLFIDNIVKIHTSSEEKEMLKQIAEELIAISKDPEVRELVENRNKEHSNIELNSVYGDLCGLDRSTDTIKVECLKSRFGNDIMSKTFRFDKEDGNYEEVDCHG